MIKILSMTGCGYARMQCADSIVTVELKSVNSRYLDVSCRTPRCYSRIEENLKSTLGKYTTRGKIDIFLYSEPLPNNQNVGMVLDEAYLASYLECLRRLRDDYNLKDDISVMSVAANSDVFTAAKKNELTPEELWKEIEPCVTEAFSGFREMKKTEGTRLGQDILEKLSVLESIIRKIESRAPKIVEEYSKRLTERIEEMCASPDYDKTRIIEEVAIFADRVAIDEELVRLRSHIAQFKAIISENKNEPCGRKLDFLLQEINREINTTGSKCSDADVAKLVVDAKSEAEKIREQVQNIE